MADFTLGINCKAYYGSADAILSALTEMTNITDVSLNLTAGEADVTTRANSGWKATAATLKEATAEFEMQQKPNDAALLAIKNAYLNGTEICLALLTGGSAVVGSEGLHGNFTITNFSRDEKLSEAVKYKVTAKLSEFIAWVVVGS